MTKKLFIGGKEFLGRNSLIMVNNVQFKHNPRALSQALFDLAKKWWFAAFCCTMGVFLINAFLIFFGVIPRIAPFLIAILSVTSEILLWQSNRVKETAEEFLRRLDLRDSFGWSISGVEMTDLLIHIPKSISKNLSINELSDKYFASETPIGTERAVENLRESAWWSKHLADRAGYIGVWITGVVFLLSLLILIISFETIKDFDTLSNIGRVVTSAIVLVFSFGLFRLPLEFYTFSRKANQFEKDAERLLKEGNIGLSQAVRLMYEYQLVRAMAPLIPTVIWRSMRNQLNELWNDYHEIN